MAELKKIIVDGVEHTLPEGGSGGGVSSVFEDIGSLPETPDDQKIYRKQQFIIYVYYYNSLINYNENIEQDGGSINFIQVKELPTNPLPSLENGVFTVYILGNDIYAHDPDYGWLSNDTIVNMLLPNFTYGGRIDSLDTSNLVSGTVYLYFGDFEYVNVCDNKKFTFVDKDKLSEEINTVKTDVSSLNEDVSSLNEQVANKQETLISGTNIKTLNGQSILGSGDIPSGVGSPGSGVFSEKFNDTSNNKATGRYSHAEGYGTDSSGNYSHAEGQSTFAHGEGSHAEGGFYNANNIDYNTEYIFTTVDGGDGFSCDTLIPVGTVIYFKNSDDNFAGVDKIMSVTGTESPYIHYLSNTSDSKEGNIYKGYVVNRGAIGSYSHVEGSRTLAFGMQSHAEGNSTKAIGSSSHAEGYNTNAESTYSHAEGYYTTASGNYGSHAEGNRTTASGDYSHAEGNGTIAASTDQHVQGRYNIEDSSNKYAHIVGNGYDSALSNAHTLDWDGNAWFKGNIKTGGTTYDDAPNTVVTSLGTPTDSGQILIGNTDGTAEWSTETLPELSQRITNLEQSGGSGGGSSADIFEEVLELPETPEENKIYIVKHSELYIYTSKLLSAVDFIALSGGTLNIIQVSSLPENPNELSVGSTLNIYIYNNGIYGYTSGTWLSNNTLASSLNIYWGGVTNLQKNDYSELTLYLYNTYEYAYYKNGVKHTMDSDYELSYTFVCPFVNGSAQLSFGNISFELYKSVKVIIITKDSGVKSYIKGPIYSNDLLSPTLINEYVSITYNADSGVVTVTDKIGSSYNGTRTIEIYAK